MVSRQVYFTDEELDIVARAVKAKYYPKLKLTKAFTKFFKEAIFIHTLKTAEDLKLKLTEKEKELMKNNE